MNNTNIPKAFHKTYWAGQRGHEFHDPEMLSARANMACRFKLRPASWRGLGVAARTAVVIEFDHPELYYSDAGAVLLIHEYGSGDRSDQGFSRLAPMYHPDATSWGMMTLPRLASATYRGCSAMSQMRQVLLHVLGVAPTLSISEM